MWFDLKGDARLGRCATENCGGQPTSRLEAGGVGSDYCSGCRAKIENAAHLDAELIELRRRLGDNLKSMLCGSGTWADAPAVLGRIERLIDIKIDRALRAVEQEAPGARED
jgi:hypothetical protein